MAWVANTVDPHMLYPQENIDAIAQRIHAPCLGLIPRLEVADAAAAANLINWGQIPINC